MKILILGSSGMLGHMVKLYLEQFYHVETTSLRWPSQEFKDHIKSSDADYLVNCIGAIPQRTKQFDVNFELPVFLDQNFNGKVIHPGTDCEIDHDEYGTSKRKAAEWIKQSGQRTKIIKTSIIGPELNGHNSFMYWFLSNSDEDTVNGYSNHFWNGTTTYYWAKFCDSLIKSWDSYSTETILYGQCYSKYEMLELFNQVFERSIAINSHETEKTVDKCLDGHIEMPDLKSQLIEMNQFYY